MSWIVDNEVASESFSVDGESTLWGGIELISGNHIVRLVHSGFIESSEVSI